MRMAAGLACLLLLAAPLAARASFSSSSSQPNRPPAPLTAGLGGGPWSEITARFDARLHKRFPAGTTESALTSELAHEGFRQTDWGGATGTEHQAERREDTFACNIAARVFWRADAAGRVQSLRGEYREAGCL
jgi:hypothetical protein